jgi:hypothetical protein
MSIVLPDALLEELLLPVVVLLLLLLLQPAAARATAAKAAIAEVRLIIFLSLIFCATRLPRSTPASRPAWASPQCDSRGMTV